MSQITVTNIQGQTSGGNANKVIIPTGHTLEVTSNSTIGGSLTAPDIRGTAIKSSNGTAAMTVATGGQVTFSQTPVNAGGGKVLQIQYGNLTTANAYSTGYGDLITINITPAATSSVILIQAQVSTHHSSVGQHAAKLVKTVGGVDSLNYEAGDFYHPSGTGVSGNISIQYVDAANTTSTITYKLQVKAEGGSGFTNKDFNATTNGVCSLVAMEIGA
tara:strand:- start:1068 stop:1718 length:651 start_codon:yes stop_codon:yes gene_type:complete